MVFTSEVPRSAAKNQTLAHYLAGRFTYHDLVTWESLIKEGKVSRNGMKASPADPVLPGDKISYDAGDFEEPPADLNYRIVYEDEWLLGVDKPGNLLVHRAGRSFRNNLIFQLRINHAPPYPECHSIHRLDRETSGVVLVAKNAASRAAFGRVLAAGGIAKVYLAIVTGAPMPQEIALPIARHDSSPISYKYMVAPHGKAAVTRITASQPLKNGLSLLTIEPITGRTHQIRVHCAAIGCPILGDKLYGKSDQEYLSWRSNPVNAHHGMSLPRQALHCRTISFIHPYTHMPCRIDAPLPADMQRLVE